MNPTDKRNTTIIVILTVGVIAFVTTCIVGEVKNPNGGSGFWVAGLTVAAYFGIAWFIKRAGGRPKNGI